MSKKQTYDLLKTPLQTHKRNCPYLPHKRNGFSFDVSTAWASNSLSSEPWQRDEGDFWPVWRKDEHRITAKKITEEQPETKMFQVTHPDVQFIYLNAHSPLCWLFMELHKADEKVIFVQDLSLLLCIQIRAILHRGKNPWCFYYFDFSLKWQKHTRKTNSNWLLNHCVYHDADNYLIQ